jgi:hypothetical protein
LFSHAVTSKLTISYHPSVIEPNGTAFAFAAIVAADDAAENDMKVYLLMTLIGTLLAAIHFTSAPKQGSKTLPQ